MMKRNRLGSTVILYCDTPDCGRCWVYDAPAVTFAAARKAAVRVGWECVRDASTRRDACRYCTGAGVPARETKRENVRG